MFSFFLLKKLWKKKLKTKTALAVAMNLNVCTMLIAGVQNIPLAMIIQNTLRCITTIVYASNVCLNLLI
jgi:hypothetical protein